MSKEVDILISEAYLKNLWWIRSYTHGYKLNKIKQDGDGNPILNKKDEYIVLNYQATKYSARISDLIYIMADMDLRKHEANTLSELTENAKGMRKCIENIERKMTLK